MQVSTPVFLHMSTGSVIFTTSAAVQVLMATLVHKCSIILLNFCKALLIDVP